ncbi:MAG: hypothetical protein GC159_17175 [Phycisphaera sp.]|nr:hypothetical protein [Phycisphaera sp.]
MSLFYPGYYHTHEFSSTSAQMDANTAKREAASAKTDVTFLEHEVDRLSLISEALWTILKQRLDLTDEDLTKMITEIDMADGKLDGKKAKGGPRMCSGCGRPNARRHVRCMYCGELMKSGPFE